MTAAEAKIESAWRSLPPLIRAKIERATEWGQFTANFYKSSTPEVFEDIDTTLLKLQVLGYTTEYGKVNIEDDGFLNPEDLDNLMPPPVTPVKKKFEVHIDDSDISLNNFDDQQPRYNGEIYFSNRKPAKPMTEAAPVQKKSSSAKKKKKRRAASAITAVFFVVVVIFSTAISAFAISCINDILAFSRSDEKIQISIPNDATTDEIIDILADNDLVKQRAFCKLFYKAFDYVKNINKTIYFEENNTPYIYTKKLNKFNVNLQKLAQNPIAKMKKIR